MHDDPATLFWRQRRVRLRPLILILDISGSMADYSRHLLQFASFGQARGGEGRGFLFRDEAHQQHHPDARAPPPGRGAGTSGAGSGRLGRRDQDRRVAGQFRPAAGARQGLCRGGVVVICSDGLDRGDPEVLAAAMERLARLSSQGSCGSTRTRAITGDFRPSTLGMMVAAPHVDLLLSGHDLASLEELAGLLPQPCTSELSRRSVRGEVERRHRGRKRPGAQLARTIVELADAIAASNGIATGIGTEPVRRAARRGRGQPGRGDRARRPRSFTGGRGDRPAAGRARGADRGEWRRRGRGRAAVIRLGSLAGYPFEGPRLLAGLDAARPRPPSTRSRTSPSQRPGPTAMR